jgi:methylmalonyl-CoA/ethylmalonyl-CoA epimerase
VAIGTANLADGWTLFGGLLGGTWAYGGDSRGFWWGQLAFSAGPKVELITPTGGPDAGFLERFLASRGPGLHHLTFVVPDLTETLAVVRAAGIEPVSVRLENPNWKEAFLHPRDAHGLVIQVAEQSGPPPAPAPPGDLPAPGPASAFALVERYVRDLDAATALFRDVLQGEVRPGPDDDAGAAELSWPGGARLRLSQPPPGDGGRGGATGPLHFRPDRGGYDESERGHAAQLARRLGVALDLDG